MTQVPHYLTSLRENLQAENIPERAYAINQAPIENQYVVQRIGKRWVYYYFERGLRIGQRSFSSEEEVSQFAQSEILHGLNGTPRTVEGG
jgi:hypothetical protein